MLPPILAPSDVATLAATFGEAELLNLAFDLSAVVSAAPHESIVDLAFDLVRWAEANGRLPALLDRAIRLRPRNRELRQTRDSVEQASRSAGPPQPRGGEPSRDQLLLQLMRLLPSQFEVLLFRLRIPMQHLSGSSAPQASRAIDVLRYLEQQNALDRLARVLSKI